MAARRPPAFLGRSAERDVLDRLLETARAGQSAVLLIRGEAGIGKTALLGYAAGQAAGFHVAEIAGVEAEMELPFAGLQRLCAPMLAQLDALPDPQQTALRVSFGLSSGDPPDRFLVALGALTLFDAVADERPLLCLVDDAQWLDAPPPQVLGFVARRLLAESVAIVFTVREPSDVGGLADLPELSLGGLQDEDARALLSSVMPGRLDDRVRDRLVAEARGCPLALVELPRGRSIGELAGGFGLPGAGTLPSQIEDLYRRRIAALPEATQQLMLLAAADPVGDDTLLWRAAATLGVERQAAEPAAAEQLLEVGAQVRFRHPLVRSAVYRAANLTDRRAVHGALAAATDPETDPDRRAWHRAHAAIAPDDAVAAELIHSANRARGRGGIAAAAAFLERAVTFTADPRERAARALTAAQMKLGAGDLSAAASLLAAADAGPLDALGQAKAQLAHAQIAFDMRRGSDAPPLLMRTAQRLESLDPELARETHLKALVAVIYAGRLATDPGPADVARAALSAPLGPEPLPAAQLLLVGLATRLTDGYAAAAPTLTAALRAYLAAEPRLDWSWIAYSLAAMDLLDDDAWAQLASRQVELTRATGTLILLPFALDYLAGFHIAAGDLSRASALIEEAQSLDLGVRAETLPYMSLRLAAWRGGLVTGVDLFEVMIAGASSRGEGCAFTGADYAMSVLYNGLGEYELAFEAAQKSAAADEIATSSWALYELVEAAARSGQHEVARESLDQLRVRTGASGTAWAKGTEARVSAFLEDGQSAEHLHRAGIEALGQSRAAAHLARARLAYGEWLRRENRRVDAREQLRQAYDLFAEMGADGFAERTRRELLATGEKVRKRRDDTRDDLTPQEQQIARLARDGLTNPEIGAELYISPRTVEWHLRKVYTKLGVSSRKGLRGTLRSPDRETTPA